MLPRKYQGRRFVGTFWQVEHWRSQRQLNSERHNAAHNTDLARVKEFVGTCVVVILSDDGKSAMPDSTFAAEIAATVLQKIYPLRERILPFLLYYRPNGDMGTRGNGRHRECIVETKLRIDKSILLPMRSSNRANRNSFLPAHDKVGEKRRRLECTMVPQGAGQVNRPVSIKRIRLNENALTDKPFASEGTPTKLYVKAKLLPSWVATEGTAGTLAESSVESSENNETITLVPYAAAKLRITSFPWLKNIAEKPTVDG